MTPIFELITICINCIKNNNKEIAVTCRNLFLLNIEVITIAGIAEATAGFEIIQIGINHAHQGTSSNLSLKASEVTIAIKKAEKYEKLTNVRVSKSATIKTEIAITALSESLNNNFLKIERQKQPTIIPLRISAVNV
jgi:hypothetical protein